jgi:hypothetical protein
MNNQPKSSKSTINIALAVIHITETGETFKLQNQMGSTKNHQPILPVAGNHL